MIVTSAVLRPKPGDVIEDPETGRREVAETCPDCLGSGLASNGYLLTYKCPTCQGTKVVWKTAMFQTLTGTDERVES